MHVLHVVGARPNFMKAAPVIRALEKWPEARRTLVHTGQHYDKHLSEIFFSQLNSPEPDVNLEVGSGSHARQTAEVMTRFEPVVLERKPDVVLVYGDVNSTVAAALVCSKLMVRVAHVEAGLRSFDRSMPEEINRLVTDQLSDLLFTPSEDGNRNLAREGIAPGKVFLAGNVMIDTLIRIVPEAARRRPADLPSRYALVTLHRPSNVDDLDWLRSLLSSLERVGHDLEVIFPVHPRTRQKISSLGIGLEKNGHIRFLEPLPYLDFLALQKHALAVITDSGGIQEETTFLGVPCLTVRENTERPVTITEGTNRLVGAHPEQLFHVLRQVTNGSARAGRKPPLWDGHAAERIAPVMLDWWQSKKSQTRRAAVEVAAIAGQAEEALGERP